MGHRHLLKHIGDLHGPPPPSIIIISIIGD